MQAARRREDWVHTSHVMAIVANTVQGLKRPFTPADFDPHSRKRQVARGTPIRKGNLERVLGVFVRKGKKCQQARAQ